MMYNSFIRVRIALLFLWAVLHTSKSVPYPGYIGAITWNWEDSGSGNEDPEEPVLPPKEGTGSSKFLLVTANFWGSAHERRLPPSERGRSCNFDQNCDKGQFCHEYYKYCQTKRYVGESCRRTENCVLGVICMWGECTKEKKPGVLESACKQHADCNQGLCCARQQGEKICKPYLTEGQNCSVVTGGLGYNFQHDCACGYGLVCQKYGWSDQHSDPLMKCVKLVA